MDSSTDEMAAFFDFGGASLPEIPDTVLADTMVTDAETQALMDQLMVAKEGVCWRHPSDSW